MKRAIIISVIIGLLCLTSIYAQTSAQGGEGGKSSSGQGGKGGDGTVIIGDKQIPPPKEESHVRPEGSVSDGNVDVEQVKRLIRDLDADDIAVRDKATEELKTIGKPALPYLEESVKSDSPEVAWRSKIIINAIKKAEQQKEPQDDSASRKIGPTLRQFGNNFSFTFRGGSPGTKGFSMAQDGSGKISVKITEIDKDGKENTNTYEANSTEEFKQKYPEIAKEYGIGEKPSISMDIPDFDFDDIFKDFGRSWDKRLEDRLNDMVNRQGKQLPKMPESKDDDVLPGQITALSSTDLGLSIEAVEDATLKEGVLVTKVEPLGLGEKMGLKQGDIIINVNNTVIKSAWECRRLLKTVLGKDRVYLTVIRSNKKETLIYPK